MTRQFHVHSRLPRWAPVIASLIVVSYGRIAAAENVCGETVSAELHIDGIPAYAQCDASLSAPIYSDDGVNTRTTSGGSGWILTQAGGGYQCTELAHRYLAFRWNIKNSPVTKAAAWCDGAAPAGMEKTTKAVHGDVIVYVPGDCNTNASTGHVAIVDVVDGDTLTVVGENKAARRVVQSTCAACFLHVLGNDGTVPDAGIPDSGLADVSSDTAAADMGLPEAASSDSIAADTLLADSDAKDGPAVEGSTTDAGVAGGAPGQGSPSDEDSGCECRAGRRPAFAGGWIAWIAVAVGWGALRRRRAR